MITIAEDVMDDGPLAKAFESKYGIDPMGRSI
jgi:hypothetical protein